MSVLSPERTTSTEETERPLRRYSLPNDHPCKHCRATHSFMSVRCGVLLFAWEGDDLAEFVSQYGLVSGEPQETPEFALAIWWKDGMQT